MSWRCLEDVLKTSWRCLEDALKKFLQDVLKTPWKCLEDVLKTYDQGEYIGLDQGVLKMSWRRLMKRMSKANIFVLIKTSSSRRMFAGKLLKEATIHFYCLFDESRFSDIYTIMELKELNWLCKHMKQPTLYFNEVFLQNSVKHKFFYVSIVSKEKWNIRIKIQIFIYF